MKKLAVVLSVATLVVGIFAGMLWKNLGAERAQLADLRSRVTEMEVAQPAVALAMPTSPAAAAIATPASTNATAAPTSPAAAASPPSAERMQQGLAKGVAEVLNSQAGQDMVRNQVKTALAQQMPDLATELRLTPSEAEKFMDLLVNQALESAGDALGMMGGTAAPDSMRKMAERQLTNEKEIVRTLGNKYPAWQEYQGTAAARQQVGQLRSLLGTGEDALTEAQSKPLIAALGVEQTRINKEDQNKRQIAARSSQPTNILEEQLKDMSAHNERLTNAASSHLTSTQLDRYKRQLAQQENMLRAIVGSMNGQGNAAGQGGAPR
ncbi:MAG: hypothetical protein ABI645_01630 [Pseudomonadota bacterium]